MWVLSKEWILHIVNVLTQDQRKWYKEIVWGMIIYYVYIHYIALFDQCLMHGVNDIMDQKR